MAFYLMKLFRHRVIGYEVTAHWPRSALRGPCAVGVMSKSKMAVGR
jgi:hypothetical protein